MNIPPGYIEIRPGEYAKPQKGHIDNDDYRSLPRPEPEPPLCDEPLAAASRTKPHAPRRRVSITSYRRRLLDPDNLCGKWFVDALRHLHVIEDDTAEDIEFSIKQIKVSEKDQERTVIEVD